MFTRHTTKFKLKNEFFCVHCNSFLNSFSDSLMIKKVNEVFAAMLEINYLLLIVILNMQFDMMGTVPNNACQNFDDYYKVTTSKNCFYNSDMQLETPDLIEKYIGNYETYRVTTDDGYILKMFRIPRKNPKGVILLQHSLSVDSRMWVGQGMNKSLAFYLWNAGYDIWMNNHRGTLHSQDHRSLRFSDFRYWDFSFHEVGFYDIPAQIKAIRSKTNNTKIIYIGHSFGSTAGLIYGSLHAKEAKDSVKAFVFMATPCLFKHSTSILTIFAPYKSLLQRFRFGNVLFFLPIGLITRTLFRLFPLSIIIFHILICLVSGFTPEETDPAIQNIDAGIYVKAFSYKSVMHYLQLIEAKTTFHMYDHGKEENLKRYNSEQPPAYPLRNFSVPIFFMSSEEDTLTTLKDTHLLMDTLPREVTVHGHFKFSTINHIQYVTGIHAEELYYKELLNFLDNIVASKK